MRRISLPFLILLVSLLLMAFSAAEAQEGITGSYTGRYQCSGWHPVELRISDSGSNRITGIFTFTARGARSKSSYSLAGWYEKRSGRFRLDPRSWIGRPPLGYVMVGLEGAFEPVSRKLEGRITYATCGHFELASSGTAREASRRSRPVRPTYRPTIANRSAPRRIVPPERRTYPTNMTGNTNYWFDYVDSSKADPEGTIREEEPIDAVIDWLRENDFNCVDTQQVTWKGKTGVARDRVSVIERYAIECDGNCKGVRYKMQAYGVIVHFGLSQPAPVLQIKAVGLGGSDVLWEFNRKEGGRPPDIFIHRWTPGKFNSGPGCKAPKI